MESNDMSNRKWTIQNLGEALAGIKEREAKRDETLHEVYKVVVVGNGEVSLREQVRTNTRWIANVNKLFWIFVVAIVGQFVALICGMVGWLYYLFQYLPK